jgi:integrase/recombinase XerC
VTEAQVEAFVRALGADGAPPSVATMRLRRSTIRSLFRTGRELGLLANDPTVDVILPSRTNEAARPLTDLEVQRCRRAALDTLNSTRLAVPWALGEATARTSEVPHITVGDVDVDRRRVWIHGSSNTEARWGTLTGWGATQIERHLRDHNPSPSTALSETTTRNTESRRAHSSQAIREAMRRAGILEDTLVRPASLTAWAGRQVLDTTRRIDLAARALGMRSLDGAARLLGWDWDTDPTASGEAL